MDDGESRPREQKSHAVAVSAALATGQGPLDLETFQRDLEKHTTGSEGTNYKLPLQDGRTILINVEPMLSGGWVTTHQDITARVRAEDALAEQMRRFDVALNNMYHGLIMFDKDKRLIVCNRRYADMYGLPEYLQQPGTPLDDIVQHRVDSGQGPADLEGYKRDQLNRLCGLYEGKSSSYKLRVMDGRVLQIDSAHMAGGGWIATHQDITEETRAETELAEQMRRFDIALNNMYHGLCMFDKDKRLIVCNRRYADMYHLPEALQQPGTPLDDIFSYRIETGQGPMDLDAYKRDQLKRLFDGNSIHYKLQLMDGRVLQIDSEHMPATGGWVATHQDITEATQAEAQINHLARHDALTNLPNRAVFRSNLEDALKRVPRGDAVAVLCLDLDQFKAVNDTLGHPVGDALLQEVADRLRVCVRDTDTASRLGGDEFAIILTTSVEPVGVTSLASRIIESLSAPYNIAGHKVVIGTSVGIALAPEDGTTPDDLLKNADLALYRAKSDGRGVYRFFEPGMDAKVQARRAMELDLRKALENEEFELFYQPLVNLADRDIVAFEALLRWRHPERGLVAPLEFIPLAEEIGLIVPIGAWVLKQACARAVDLAEPHQGLGQSVAGSIQEQHARPQRHVGAQRLGARSEKAGARDHRNRDAARHRGNACDADAPARTRRFHLDGRFRHRLFVTELFAEISVRQDQDRPEFRAQPVRRRRKRGDRSRRHRPWPQSWDDNDRRRRRDDGSTRRAAQGRMHRGARLPVQRAGAGRRDRRAA